MCLRVAAPAADPGNKSRTLDHWCIVSADTTNFPGNSPNNFLYHFLWDHSTIFHTIFLYVPSCCQDVWWQTTLTHTPGKRITLEHTLRHHFRTQPFCITLEHKIKHLMETPPYTHIRFTDRRETLEEKRVPKRDQHKKTPRMRILLVSTMS